MDKFKQRNGATQCKLLKGVGTGKIPELHLAFLSEAKRKNVRKIEGNYLSQRRIYGIRL
ncbi:hypothetical protein [Prevotella merdae]|uniref:hypothetical protein n=1 Tax=Prevotella merdae TaxID=2079531 RepID=UPI003F7F5648